MTQHAPAAGELTEGESAVVPWPADIGTRYRELGYWTGDTFWDLLTRVAERQPKGIAVVDGERRVSYRQLHDRAARLASGFRELGVERGSRVVVQLANVAEFFETMFALTRIGAVPVFALPTHRFAEISHFCEHTGASAYVIEAHRDGFDYRALAEQVVAAVPGLRVVVVGEPGPFVPLDSLRVEPERGPAPAGPDVALLQLSGGSTGTPKLIPRTHDDYLYSVRASAQLCECDETTRYLVALPAAHNFPLSSPGTLGVLHAGGTAVLALNPSPDAVFALIEQERVTITAAVPPLARAWLAAAKRTGRDLSSLRTLQVGGAKFDEGTARRVRPELGCDLQQVFGMAEGLVNYTRLDDPEHLVVGTQGSPLSPADEVRVVDDEDEDLPQGAVGHLLTRGPYTIRGYYREPEHNRHAFTAGGFYRTGDLVRLTEEGYLVVAGRAKDQINRGGEKVASEEVENHLLKHGSVHDAAVVAMPDSYLGERSCAFVILRRGAPAADPAEFRELLRSRGLAEYKLPDRVEVVDDFPHTCVGKVDKKDLRAAISRMLAARSQASSAPAGDDQNS